MLEKTLRRVKQVHLLKVIEENPNLMGLNNIELIYSEVAKGHITTRELISKYVPNPDEEEKDEDSTLTQRFIRKARGIAKGVTVGGIENTLISYGKCCNPIPGDEIIGYVTQGRGVTIHRTSCKNYPISSSDRLITVEWNISNDVSRVLAITDLAWRPNDNEMENISFDNYDWKKWEI